MIHEWLTNIHVVLLSSYACNKRISMTTHSSPQLGLMPSLQQKSSRERVG